MSRSCLLTLPLGARVQSSMALLPPYLQNLGGYSITTTGLLMEAMRLMDEASASQVEG